MMKGNFVQEHYANRSNQLKWYTKIRYDLFHLLNITINAYLY